MASRGVSSRGSTKARAWSTWRSPRRGDRDTDRRSCSCRASRSDVSCSLSVRCDSDRQSSQSRVPFPSCLLATRMGTHPSRIAACRLWAELSAATPAASDRRRCRVASIPVRSGMHTLYRCVASPPGPRGAPSQTSSDSRAAWTIRTPSRNPSRTPVRGSTYRVGWSATESLRAPMIGTSHKPADVGPAITAATPRSASWRAREDARSQATDASLSGREYTPLLKRDSAPAPAARSRRSCPMPWA